MPSSRSSDITEATADDVAAIGDFFREAWAEAGPEALGWSGADESVIEEIAAPEAVRARIGGPERRMFLAWRDGRVVGFAANRRIDGASVELAGVIVMQRMIGQGMGGDLIEAAAAAAIADGFRRMMVRTEVDNDRARSVYERHGFVATGELVEEVEGISVAVVELERTLD